MNTSEHLTALETIISDSTSPIPPQVRDQLIFSTGYRSGKIVMKRRLLLSSTFSCLLTILAMQLFQPSYTRQLSKDNLAKTRTSTFAEPRNASSQSALTDGLRTGPPQDYLATTPRSRFLIDSNISENDLPRDLTADSPHNILTPRNLIGL